MRSLRGIGMSDRRIASTVIIVALAIFSFFGHLDGAVDRVARPLNRSCDSYLKAWTNQAVATAGTAVVFSAGLSVVEDTEVELAPVGIGASVALGDAVRPVNDLVSKVLYVALASAVSLKIQSTLIGVGSWIGLRWFLTFSLLFLAFAVWSDWGGLRRLAWGFFVLALVARLLIPGAIFLTGTIGDHFTKGVVEQAQEDFRELESQATATKDELVAAVPTVDDVAAALNPVDRKPLPSFRVARNQLSGLLGELVDMRDSVINLALTYLAVFVAQTLIMPILILWGLIKLPKYLIGPTGLEKGGDWFIAQLRGGRSEGQPPQVGESSV